MMDIATQAEIVLRDAAYETWLWTGTTPAVICFESPVLVGFVHVFESADALLGQWEERQRKVLSRHAIALRTAGVKAWNVYSIFLTEERAPSRQRAIERLEENFSLTRKIARAAICTYKDLEYALLPLTAIKSQPVLEDADFEDRLRSQLKGVPRRALNAFFGDQSEDDVARALGAV